MACYVNLVDSDTDDDVSVQASVNSAEQCLVALSSDSDPDYTPAAMPANRRSTRSRTRALRHPMSNRRRKSTRKTAVSACSVVNDLDSNSNSSCSSTLSGQISALKETQVSISQKRKSPSKVAVTSLESVSSIPKENLGGFGDCLVDSENVQPANGVVIKKNSAGSDSDTDDGAPVVKKPTKSRTFRRGLSRQKSNSVSESLLSVAPQDSAIYSTCVSNCMNALRKGSINVPFQLMESESENEEVVFISKSLAVPSADKDILCHNEDDRLSVSPTRDDSLLFANRSPSPPPSPEATILHPKQLKLNQNVKNAIKFLYEAEPSNFYQPIPEADVVIDLDAEETEKKEILVKVRSRSGIQRFPLPMTDPFKTIFIQMAGHEGVEVSQIVMFRREESIKPSDTPTGLNLHVADIIDCRIGDPKSLDSSYVDEDSFITITVRSSGLRSKTSVKVKKDKPLESGLREFCDHQSLSMAKVKFQFDGDSIQPTQTPEDLDLDDGDCIDAFIVN